MWTLDRPEYSARVTFTTCISNVRDDGLKARLQGVTQAVVDASSAFDAAAQQQTLHEIGRQPVVGGIVTTAEMGKVYADRMVKKGAPGRHIYDDIIAAPPQGRCPLCGQRPVSTLDHHLPKAHYPALAVAPLNLVPSCSDCNKAKLDGIPRTSAEVSLHPYFDDVDGERWLVAEVIETQPAAVRFKVVIPPTWDGTLGQRVHHHFKTLGLGRLYASEAAEELTNIRHQLINLRVAAGT
ncbi:MAG: hypothetical protein M0006_06445 [Magnetospirillum sp.]|nr:hypothetical protein [Magnetospirillum sp.]